MKRILLAGATLLALTATQPVSAADAPVYKGPPPAAAALFNWSGFYFGGQLGYLWGNNEWTIVGVPVTYNVNGVLGGGHIGFNWQTGQVVFGIEADINWTGAKGDDSGFAGVLDETRIRYTGSVRGRLGVAMNTWLWYVTGGWAAANVEHNRVSVPISDTQTMSGWTLGTGLSVAATPNFIWGLEYRYSDYGTKTFTFGPISAPGTNNLKTHEVTVRASWKM